MQPLSPEPRDAFLSYFDERKRGTVSNWMLEPIRQQHIDIPRLVLASVVGMLQRRITSQWATEESIAPAQHAIDLIHAHPAEALACAQYYIDYAALPESERMALKEQQRETGKAMWMATKPPTQKQLDYLHILGADEMPQTMAEASKLIDALRSGGRARR